MKKLIVVLVLLLSVAAFCGDSIEGTILLDPNSVVFINLTSLWRPPETVTFYFDSSEWRIDIVDLLTCTNEELRDIATIASLARFDLAPKIGEKLANRFIPERFKVKE